MGGFLSFVKKEMLHILRDRRTMLIVLGIPVMQLLLFGFAISVEINNIDFAVVAPHPTVHFFGLNLADTPSISHPSIIWIIPILSGLTAFLSSYIMQKMQGTQNSAAAGQMKMLNFMMPLMSLYFAFILPGAIGIYWIFNNVFTCVQEIILTKTLRGKQEAKQAAEAARIEAEKQAKREAHKAAQKQQSQNAKNKKGDK